MTIGYFDIILISLACLLILVSLVVNILSTTKVSRLSEGLDQLESSFEQRLTLKKRRLESVNKPDSDSEDKYLDSSILPTAEKTAKDSGSKARYRPPSTTIIPSSAPVEKDKEKTPVGQDDISTSLDAQEGGDILVVKSKKDKTKEIERLDDEQKELLKNYLGGSSIFPESPKGADLKKCDEGGSGEAASEVMEVMEDTRSGMPPENTNPQTEEEIDPEKPA